ncbi:zinc ABC transporter substrate-binding protein [Aerococcus agrisoli]|uniref:Zinc ABC transporter substrate-binding protein n=2 Tax=Aerococcus agrisoli TaxID=2487350 RepID=A0A3N4GJM8_9LACT|nr:zinc ABC transporter substrate-binding protein [Aerococcus agrisoli]
MAVLFLTACSQTGTSDAASNEQSDGLKIVTTFYPMQALTQAVVGDTAEVTAMMANEEVHDYEPSARDIATLNEADVFVYNSEDMETWVPSLLESLQNDDLLVIEASADVATIDGDVITIEGDAAAEEEHAEDEVAEEELSEEAHSEGDGHNHDVDPHTWLDPVNAATEMQTIAEAISAYDAKNAEFYQENMDEMTSQLFDLNAQYQTLFADAENKLFLTQHAAFGYLANRYGLNQVAVTGLTESAEPSAKRIAAIVDYINANAVSVMYIQKGGSSTIADTIAAETGVNIGELQSMESVDIVTYPANGQGFMKIMTENLESLSQVVH